jgi:hypothetical protein
LQTLACKACPPLENQVLIMRAAMTHWRHYGAENDAKGDEKPAK